MEWIIFAKKCCCHFKHRLSTGLGIFHFAKKKKNNRIVFFSTTEYNDVTKAVKMFFEGAWAIGKNNVFTVR